METRKRVLRAKHSSTLTSISNLASIYKIQRWWKKAKELEVQAIEIFKRVLREEHPSTLISISNLVLIYRN